MYADDTEMESNNKPICPDELEQNLNDDLANVMSYCYTNSLNVHLLRVNLCRLAYTSLSKATHILVLMNNEPLERISTAKHIGMYIDEHLKDDCHIKS